MATRLGGLDPSKFVDETFELYSIPAYDSRNPVIVAGEEIGSTKQIVQPRDVLLSKIVPHIRRSWIVGPLGDRRQIASGEWIVFRSGDAAPEYLRHVLLGDDFHAQFMQTVSGVGGSLLRARPAQVAKIQIPLPPLPEQHRIAAILDKADALRTKRREALAQLDRLAHSIFVEMFGAPATNPNGWPVIALKELGKVSTGGTPPSALDGMFGGDIPFVTPGDLESDQPVKRTVTEAGALEAGTVRAGAALVCCIGTIGKMGMATVRSSFNQQINAVEWYSEHVDDHYGLEALRFFKPTIISWGASTTVPILKKSRFAEVSIPVPPIAMQREFAKRSRAVARLGEQVRNGMAADARLFAALQSRAFRGEL